MTIKNGGPAFPMVNSEGWPGLINELNDLAFTSGMTLRDYFAAKALQGICANNQDKGDAHDKATWAYRMADAMLKARETDNE